MELAYPNWPAPSQVNGFSTTRNGGISQPPFDTLNLGFHVGDDVKSVQCNRDTLNQLLPAPALWLNQIHSNTVVVVDSDYSTLGYTPDADAFYTQCKNQPLAIMTADCLPLFLCDRQGSQVAVVHGGWRGLANGIIANTIAHFSCSPDDILAYLGPAIGPNAFEVGIDVVDAFASLDTASIFKAKINGKYWADIFSIARAQLAQLGIKAVSSQELCTYQNSDLFFSYRRNSNTGRMAHVIWLSQS